MTLPVPFNNLLLQWEMVKNDVQRDFDDVFASSAFCLGPQADAFERDLASYLGVEHAIGVNSGTSALHLAALASDLGPGDEVLVPSHTFVATLWAVLYVGATPILCDVEAGSGTIDLVDAERRVTEKTKAIIPVHLYGQPADLKAVGALADKHELTIIEDAAQAVGATWGGRKVGSIGRFGCISFYPGKNLGAAGEAGVVVTSDSDAAQTIRALRNHGQSSRYRHDMVGYNYRLDALQAVVLRRKLRFIDEWTEQRAELAARYLARLASSPLQLPTVVHGDHVWHLFVVRHENRDELANHLKRSGIETGLHYPIPMHRQPCLSGLDKAGSFPQADRWADQCLSLPLFVGMTTAQQDRVIAAVEDYFAGRGPA